MTGLVSTLAIPLLVSGAMSAPTASSPRYVVDPGIVQDVTLLEVNSNVDVKDPKFCKSVLPEKNNGKACESISRTWRLKDEWRARALDTMNKNRMTPGMKCVGPRHVLLVETTEGKKAFEWNFDCKLAPPPQTAAWAEFFHAFGIVQHMPKRNLN
jgi:hypothetical protein